MPLYLFKYPFGRVFIKNSTPFINGYCHLSINEKIFKIRQSPERLTDKGFPGNIN